MSIASNSESPPVRSRGSDVRQLRDVYRCGTRTPCRRMPAGMPRVTFASFGFPAQDRTSLGAGQPVQDPSGRNQCSLRSAPILFASLSPPQPLILKRGFPSLPCPIQRSTSSQRRCVSVARLFRSAVPGGDRLGYERFIPDAGGCGPVH